MKTKTNRHNRREREFMRQFTRNLIPLECSRRVDLYAWDEVENTYFFMGSFGSIGNAYDYCYDNHIPIYIARFYCLH